MEIVQEYNIGEFRGNFPDVPIADGVDMAEIKANDADPFFVTLPIVSEVGAISKNGLWYDDALVSSIEEQINRKRPGGIFGHLKDEDRASSYPAPEAMWVGAKRVGGALWAKAWVHGSARERLKRIRAVGGNIATSIYGKGDKEKLKNGSVRLTNFNLESLDFAPPERAALGYGAPVMVTSELEQEEPEMADKSQILAELTASEVPAPVREQIVREAQASGDNAREVQELTTQLGDAQTMVKELQLSVAEFRIAAFTAAIDKRVSELTAWSIKGDEATKKVEAFRRMLKSRIIAELNGKQDAALVTEAANAAWADLEPLAETVRDALSGPAAVVNGRVRGAPKLEVTPEATAAARGQFQF